MIPGIFGTSDGLLQAFQAALKTGYQAGYRAGTSFGWTNHCVPPKGPYAGGYLQVAWEEAYKWGFREGSEDCRRARA